MNSNTKGGASANQPRSQYQHFIPRFILRGFAEDTPVPDGTLSKAEKAKFRKQARNNATIKVIELPTGALGTRLLGKEFGLVNMYRDHNADVDKQDEIEEMLAHLENDASEVIRRARDTFKSTPNAKLILSREERNRLRRFLFLMKYRNRIFHGRYDCTTIDGYTANDKAKMQAYLQETGQTSPHDVWLANLKVFLTIKLDATKTWTKEPPQGVYPDDWKLFRNHVESTYMAFCRPQRDADEFILTESAYGIFEGPCSMSVDPATGANVTGTYTEWHNFAPLSNSLMIVLRSNMLPSRVKNNFEPARKVLHAAMKARHNNPEGADSILLDLPFERAEASYAVEVNGKLEWKSGVTDWSDDDTFSFKCFPIQFRHVQLINTIMLENVSTTKVLTYRSPVALARTLKNYLENETGNFKVSYDQSDRPFEYLLALKRALEALGETANIKANFLSSSHMALHVGAVLGSELRQRHPDLVVLHGRTCARASSEKPDFDADMKQASYLMLLAIKTDVGLKEAHAVKSDADTAREIRLAVFMRQPTQVFWLYLKIVRNLPNFEPDDYTHQKAPLRISGPEDSVLQCMFTANTPETFSSRQSSTGNPRGSRTELAKLLFVAARM